MTFRKNWFSCILWAFYAVCACAGFVYVMFCVLERTPLSDFAAQIGIVCLSIVLAAGIFLLCRRLVQAKQTKVSRTEGLIWEAFLAILLLGAGLMLRIYFIGNGGEEAAYYETARVTGESIAPIAHGAQYFYVLLLRGLFFFSGNHFGAGILLQIALQMLAAVVWYFAVRRICGSAASIILLSGIMLFPACIKDSLLYSPKMLYLLLYGILLCMIGRLLKRQKENRPLKWYAFLQTAVTGAGIGLLSYLDVSGLTLLLPVAFLFTVQRTKEKEAPLKKNTGRLFAQAGTVLGAFLAAAALSVYVDASQSGNSAQRVFETWLTLFAPKAQETGMFSGIFTGMTLMELGITAAIAFLLLLGIPAFFAVRRTESQLLWFVLAAALALICGMHFQTKGMTADYLLLTVLLVLAGAGMQSLLRKTEVLSQEAYTEAIHMEEPPMEEVCAEKAVTEEVIKEKEPEKEAPREVQKKVKYIENPLPLPKKHVKKTMGYQREVSSEKMGYDIEVPETDDFDI